MKENEAPNPVEIELFRAKRIVFDPQMPADALKKFRRRGGISWGDHEEAFSQKRLLLDKKKIALFARPLGKASEQRFLIKVAMNVKEFRS